MAIDFGVPKPVTIHRDKNSLDISFRPARDRLRLQDGPLRVQRLNLTKVEERSSGDQSDSRGAEAYRRSCPKARRSCRDRMRCRSATSYPRNCPGTPSSPSQSACLLTSADPSPLLESARRPETPSRVARPPTADQAAERDSLARRAGSSSHRSRAHFGQSLSDHQNDRV